MLKIDPARALEPVRAVQETGRQALVEMKRLVGMLREHDEEIGLEPQPGLAEVDRLVAKVREAGLPVELHITGETRTLPLGIDLSAYRVLQEALTNALKHGAPEPLLVSIRYAADAVELEVAHTAAAGRNGEGGGHGLVGMRERIAVFGGEFEAGPVAGGRSTVSSPSSLCATACRRSSSRTSAGSCFRVTVQPETYRCHYGMLWCVRTTIRLDDELLRDAKAAAYASGRTLTALIEDALRVALARRSQRTAASVDLSTFKGGGGLQPGVDLDDNVALLDLMDRLG